MCGYAPVRGFEPLFSVLETAVLTIDHYTGITYICCSNWIRTNIKWVTTTRVAVDTMEQYLGCVETNPPKLITVRKSISSCFVEHPPYAAVDK